MTRRVIRTAALSTSVGTVAAIFLLTTPANATKWECGERSNLSLEGKNYCAAGDFRLSESKLRKLLASMLQAHERAFGDTDAFSKAQAAFDTYRDNQCIAKNRRLENKPYHPMIVAQCKTRLTNLRIDELKRMQPQD